MTIVRLQNESWYSPHRPMDRPMVHELAEASELEHFRVAQVGDEGLRQDSVFFTAALALV